MNHDEFFSIFNFRMPELHSPLIPERRLKKRWVRSRGGGTGVWVGGRGGARGTDLIAVFVVWFGRTIHIL